MTLLDRLFPRSTQPGQSKQRAAEAVGGLGTGRIEAFSDGVFAVAITLLVLNLQIPHETQESKLALDLFNELSKFAIYGLSFMIVGIYWVSHHNTFHYIKHSNRILLWLNNLLLLFIVFIPFPTALLGEYWDDRLAIIIYASTLIATGLVLQTLWWYVTYHHHLVEKDIDPNLVRRATRRNLTAPLIYLMAIVISFLNVFISLCFLLLVPILYIMPGRIDQHWVHKPHQEASESAIKASTEKINQGN